MTLEVAVAANTAAIERLIARLDALANTIGVPPAVAAEAAKIVADAQAAEPPKPARSRKAAEKAPEPAAAPAAAAAPAPAPVKAEPVTYAEAAKALTALIQRRGKPAAIELLAKFGVTKLPEAKPEQYADIVASCTVEA